MNLSKHHKSPFTNAAIVMSIVGFCLNFTVPLSLFPAIFAMGIVLATGCCRVAKPCLIVGVVLAVVSSICAFVVFAAAHSADRKTVSLMSIFGGLLWLVTAFLIYKIPAPDPKDPITSSSSDGPTSTIETAYPAV